MRRLTSTAWWRLWIQGRVQSYSIKCRRDNDAHELVCWWRQKVRGARVAAKTFSAQIAACLWNHRVLPRTRHHTRNSSLITHSFSSLVLKGLHRCISSRFKQGNIEHGALLALCTRVICCRKLWLLFQIWWSLSRKKPYTATEFRIRLRAAKNVLFAFEWEGT